MGLITIVYVSLADHRMTQDELLQILDEARENNKKNDITGMLLYRNNFFIQALEGDAYDVEPLYEKIKTDNRHRNVITVYKNVIQDRVFTDWSMGCNELKDHHLEDVDGYRGTLDTDFFEEKPARAIKLLESFRNQSYF